MVHRLQEPAPGPNRGWFRTADGRRCDPFTLSDAHSRYLLRCQAVARPDEANARPIFETAFQEHGLPRAIRSDNDPFGQRPAFCLAWGGRLVTAGGVVDQARHPARADHCRQAAARRCRRHWLVGGLPLRAAARQHKGGGREGRSRPAHARPRHGRFGWDRRNARPGSMRDGRLPVTAPPDRINCRAVRLPKRERPPPATRPHYGRRTSPSWATMVPGRAIAASAATWSMKSSS